MRLLVFLVLLIEMIRTKEVTDEQIATFRNEFEEYDMNKDGFVTIDEIMEVLKDEHGVSVEEVTEMFQLFDHDKDQKLDWEEYKKTVIDSIDRPHQVPKDELD